MTQDKEQLGRMSMHMQDDSDGPWKYQPRPHKRAYRPSLTAWMLFCIFVLFWIWVIAAVVT